MNQTLGVLFRVNWPRCDYASVCFIRFRDCDWSDFLD